MKRETVALSTASDAADNLWRNFGYPQATISATHGILERFEILSAAFPHVEEANRRKSSAQQSRSSNIKLEAVVVEFERKIVESP